ncbi:MAG: AI-2E family transporter [Candidatus Gracilibacteria bacterium]
MKHERINKFIQSTSKNIKHLRQTLQQLRDRHKENQKIGLSAKENKAAKKEEFVVHFSLMSTAKATIVVLVLIALSHFLGEITRVILIFFIAILLSAALTPTVNSLRKYKIPRPLSVLLMFLLLLLILGFFVSQLIPLVATQLIELAKSLTSLINKIGAGEVNIPFGLGDRLGPIFQDILAQVDKETVINELKTTLEGFAGELQTLAGDTLGVLKAIFNGIFNFVLVLILTFFLIVNGKDVNDFFVSLFPSRHGAYIMVKIEAIQGKIGYWLRGQMILMLLMFSLSLTGLLILGVDNALTLAMMAGIAELLPVVGPIAAGIPAILVAFNESPWLAIWVLGLIILLQQIEGNILVPLVMRKAVGLSPIIIILAMMIGLETLGIVGMLMAIPVATTLSIFVKEYAEKEK